MKILHVGKWYPWSGGIETVRDDIVDFVSSKGHVCDLLCESPTNESKEFILNQKSKVITVPVLFKITRVPIAPQIITKLRIIASEYELIHLHQPDPIALLALALSGYKGKVVTHWHADINEYKFLASLYNPLANWLLRRSDIIIATTRINAESSPNVKKFLNKTRIVPIGISDVKHFPEKVKEIKQQYGKKIVFAMGRLVKYKGFEYLIESAKYLPDDTIVLIGGKGPLYDDLKSKIDSLNMNHKVKMLGFISDDDVSVYYDACELFCMPSIDYGEAFGIVQVEGMAHGKPIVTTDIPLSGVPWVNKDGYSGFNVEVMNAKALADAINKLLDDDKLRMVMGGNARKRYEELFTKSVMVNNVYDIYNELLNYSN